MRHLSLAYITTFGAAPLDQIRAAATAGFDSLGLRMMAPTGQALAHPIAGNAGLIGEIASACDDHGVTIFDIEVVTLAPDFEAASLLPLLDCAARLRARFVQVVGEDPHLGRAADNLARLGAAAGERGLTLALEFMAFRAIATLGDALAVLTRSGCAHAGLLIDALHLSRSGGQPVDVVALPAGSIAFVQLCDAPAAPAAPAAAEDMIREARTARLYPGEGALPLRELLAAAPDAPLSIEVPDIRMADNGPGERAARAMQWTRAFFAPGEAPE